MYTSGSVSKLEYEQEYMLKPYIREIRECNQCGIALEEYRESFSWNGIKHPSGIYTIEILISPDYYRCANCYTSKANRKELKLKW